VSRKRVCILVFLLVCTSAFAQESKTQDTTKDSKATIAKKKATKSAAATKSTAKTQATTKDQGAAKGTKNEAAKEQGASKKVPKDVIILKGAPMGGVKFMHTAHSKDRNVKCETCHHPSKTEKPATAAQQACTDCHASMAKPPMKTKLQAAFHNGTATAGICIDCHKAENATGKKAPTKCLECHKKTNV
jgi:Class III cytochrome C family